MDSSVSPKDEAGWATEVVGAFCKAGWATEVVGAFCKAGWATEVVGTFCKREKISCLCPKSKLGLSVSSPDTHWLSSKGPNYLRGVLLISSGAIEGHFKGKTQREGHQGGSCSCPTMYRLTGHLQPRRNWPTWASSVLITHPILRNWPRQTTICSLDWKKTIERSPFFVRREGHCCCGDLIGRTNFWIFLSGLQRLEQWAKKCIELRGEFVE